MQIFICILKMVNVSTTVMLDTRRALKDGRFPVKLRITYKGKQKYYSTHYYLSEGDFAKVKGEKPRNEFKTLLLEFNSIEQRAIDVIKEMAVFSFESFEKRFLDTSDKQDVFSAFPQRVKELTKEGRAGTASSYDCAFRSLSSFAKSKTLPFSNITVDFLKSYECWMLENGKSITTVGIYLRALKSIFNNAIQDGEVKAELYPFGKRKYQIPAGRNIKKALSLSDIEKIFLYVPNYVGEAKARDYWIFSYLCNGINVKDIARLKYKNINSERITFIRAKTERTSRQNLKPIVAMVTPEVLDIIKRWGNKPEVPEAFVFPILTNGLTPEQELAKVRQATKTINVNIKKIAKSLGIEKAISTYSARHSFSTVLKRSNTPMALISEALGHNNMKTTENYLDSFEDDVKRKYASALTAFPNKKD